MASAPPSLRDKQKEHALTVLTRYRQLKYPDASAASELDFYRHIEQINRDEGSAVGDLAIKMGVLEKTVMPSERVGKLNHIAKIENQKSTSREQDLAKLLVLLFDIIIKPAGLPEEAFQRRFSAIQENLHYGARGRAACELNTYMDDISKTFPPETKPNLSGRSSLTPASAAVISRTGGGSGSSTPAPEESDDELRRHLSALQMAHETLEEEFLRAQDELTAQRAAFDALQAGRESEQAAHHAEIAELQAQMFKSSAEHSAELSALHQQMDALSSQLAEAPKAEEMAALRERKDKVEAGIKAIHAKYQKITIDLQVKLEELQAQHRASVARYEAELAAIHSTRAELAAGTATAVSGPSTVERILALVATRIEEIGTLAVHSRASARDEERMFLRLFRLMVEILPEEERAKAVRAKILEQFEGANVRRALAAATNFAPPIKEFEKLLEVLQVRLSGASLTSPTAQIAGLKGDAVARLSTARHALEQDRLSRARELEEILSQTSGDAVAGGEGEAPGLGAPAPSPSFSPVVKAAGGDSSVARGLVVAPVPSAEGDTHASSVVAHNHLATPPKPPARGSLANLGGYLSGATAAVTGIAERTFGTGARRASAGSTPAGTSGVAGLWSTRALQTPPPPPARPAASPAGRSVTEAEAGKAPAPAPGGAP